MILPMEQVKEIPKMIEQGMTVGQIAYEFGCSKRNVSRYMERLRKAGYEIKTKLGRPPVRIL